MEQGIQYFKALHREKGIRKVEKSLRWLEQRVVNTSVIIDNFFTKTKTQQPSS